MPFGTLEVLLVSAKGLDNADILANMDPYVLVTVRTQEKKSNVVSAQGSEPEWNETFSFTVSDGVDELRLKIMDKDNFSADDFVGEAIIPLESLFMEGSLPPTTYNVVNQEKEFCGEIRVGLTFTPKGSEEGHGQRHLSRPEERSRGGYDDYSEEGHGGRRQSSRPDQERHRGGYDDYSEDTHGGRRRSSRAEDDDQEVHGGRSRHSSNADQETYGGWKESSF